WTDGTTEVTTEKNVKVGGGVTFSEENADVCDTLKAGTVRWTGEDFEGCDGNAWLSLTFAPAPEVPTVTTATGRVWMDRNLVASRVAQSIDDAEAFGGLYQWGRATDGHEIIDPPSETTGTLSSGSTPGHNKFIMSDGDWMATPDPRRWQAVDGINNPCPPGFRVPTMDEFNELLKEVGSPRPSSEALFNSKYRMVTGVERDHADGTIDTWSSTGYWTSTPGSTTTSAMNYAVVLVRFLQDDIAQGYHVRCISEE
ncbi:MAG: hypothetical protein D3906_15480, partial [Candidatus Electrothrix sp. AUS1_2]|nr:hypothetical protein [Candidatus Electrothrix sp. AUS1_2]